MINPRNGALSEDPAFRIGPTLTRSEFLAADWCQGAADWVINEPWHSWKLDGRFSSMELSFIVILRFEGERLAQIELSHSDGTFGTSWDDYSDQNEQRRKQCHDAWLTECLGAQRSLAWGTVSSSDGYDPHGAGAATICITYAAAPPESSPLQGRGSNVPPSGSDVRPKLEKELPSAPRKVRRRWWGLLNWYVSFVLSALIAVSIVGGIAATVWFPIRLVVTAFGTPIVALEELATSNADRKGGNNYYIGYRCTFDGETSVEMLSVSGLAYSNFQAGLPVPARAMRLWKWNMYVVLDHDINLPEETFWTVSSVMMIDGIVALVLWTALYPRVQRRRLVREGIPCSGTLTSARIGGMGRGATYYLSFKFKTTEGVEMTNENSVNYRAYGAARNRPAALTVLYDSTRPQRSIAYEYCEYEVVPSTASQRRIDVSP